MYESPVYMLNKNVYYRKHLVKRYIITLQFPSCFFKWCEEL